MTLGQARGLIVTVRLHAGRYHGEPEWPPAPARLFQALVAGCARASKLHDDDIAALEWLESRPPPTIIAPAVYWGQAVKLWVPNNDLDARGGDPRAVVDIRTGKQVRPRMFDSSTPIVYAWAIAGSEDERRAIRVTTIALSLYQLGRGIDMASASGMVVGESELERLLDDHPGILHRPLKGMSREGALLCPVSGSLSSLEVRHEAQLARFRTEGKGRAAVVLFRQPPKPRFEQVAYETYETVSSHALFDLRPPDEMGAFCVTPCDRIVQLAEALRDAAADRLAAVLPSSAHDIQRALVGRRVEGLASVSPEIRVRIVPLPSIGHRHVDLAIRRALVEVPAGNPLRADDVFWAFSGLTVQTPSGARATVTRADEWNMLDHYAVGPGRRARCWRTVSPAALPAMRRRIEPTRRSAEAKGSTERAGEEASARAAVQDALRHAGIRQRVADIRVQREPFTAKGSRAEAFAKGSRFSKEALWHVEVVFRTSVAGPVVIGDGRFVGLGIMSPVRDTPAALVLRVTDGPKHGADPMVIAAAARRAVLARYQKMIGSASIPVYVSGHSAEGHPAKDEPHLSYVFDTHRRRILIVPPHVRDGEARSDHRRYFSTLMHAVEGLDELLAGRAGRLMLESHELDPDQDPLFAPSRLWTSLTPYVVNRHYRRNDARLALAQDIEASCRQAGLPKVGVRVRDAWGDHKHGLSGVADLEFRVAVCGPLLLGRTRYKGGGLFEHAKTS